MPKKFDKKNSVTFKVVWKSSDDPAEADKLLSERIFSIVEPPKSKQTPTYLEEKKKVLSMFTKEELGNAKKKKPKKTEADYESDPAFSQVKGREDLWITHLMRMRAAQEAAEAEEDDDEDDDEAPKLVKQNYKKSTVSLPKPKPKKKETEKKKDNEEEDGWEDCDEDGEGDGDEEDDGEEYEIEEWEEEEEDIEGEEQGLKKEEEIKIEKIVKEKVVEDKKTKKEEKKIDEITVIKKEGHTTDEDEDQNVDLTKVKYTEDVKTKRFDKLGLPVGRYNYNQHLVEASEGGPAQFSFQANYEKAPELAIEVDIPVEKMTQEEREVFEALQYEGEDNAYEEMDEDFMSMLTEGKKYVMSEEEKAKLAEENKKKQQQQEQKKADEKKTSDAKKVTFGGEKITEISTTKKVVAPVTQAPLKDSIFNKKDFQKVIKEHVETLKEKFKDEREANRKRYHLPESDSEEAVDDDDGEWSHGEDDVDREEAMKFFDSRIPFEQDIAMQQMLNRSTSESESEEETEVSKNDEKISSAQFPTGPTPKLNVIDETANKKKKRKNKGDTSVMTESKNDESMELNLRKEELFNKRDKNETKEQKEERRKLQKQFKQERKDKKKKFKETFDAKKKQAVVTSIKQAENLQGLSIYKLS